MPTRRTHWMRAHGLTKQHLPAAPMVTVEADATTPEAVVMLHDFAFRSPAEIMAKLGGSMMHDMADAGGTMTMADGSTMAVPAMSHANDVTHDACRANNRRLSAGRSRPDTIRGNSGDAGRPSLSGRRCRARALCRSDARYGDRAAGGTGHGGA